MYLWLTLLQVTSILASNADITRLVNLIKDSTVSASSYIVRTDNKDLLGSSTVDPTADYGEFDFIVVGSGAAGAALASRLTENGRWNVLLLEAGGMSDELGYIPFFNRLITLSDRNWGYTTTPQYDACLARNNNQCPVNRGKVLGGTTLFASSYVRASRQDFNNWAAQGNSGWSYKDVLPYLKRLENFTINKNRRYHGFKGPITISSVQPDSQFDKPILEAFENIGITQNQDFNGAQLSGASTIQYAHRNGNLSSAVDYILRAQGRPNFNLTLNAFVTKILICEQTKTAYGVIFVKDNITYTATVRKEVIISAGSINSAKLLMLSGVGPRSELEKHHIPVIKNLPVGLFSKIQISFSFFASTSDYTEPSRDLRDLVKEYLYGLGLLTVESNFRTHSFFYGNGSLKINPNLIIALSYPTPFQHNPISFTNLRDNVVEWMASINYTNTFEISVYLISPIASGNITLQSNDIRDFPNINQNILEDDRDLESIYQAVQLALKLIKELKKNSGKNFSPFVPIPFCGPYKNDKRYWYCVIRYLATSYNYASGTVKMGPASDPSSVVNNALQVYDIVGLRVADFAVVPVASNSAGGSTGYVIGEKAADILNGIYSPENNQY